MNGDQQEALNVIATRPKSFAVLAEHLGLSGETYELRSLCDALDELMKKGLIEQDPSPGWQHIRWRATSLGLASLGTRP